MTTRELRRATRVDKPTERVEAHEIERVEERERGVKLGEVGAKIGKSRRNLKLSLSPWVNKKTKKCRKRHDMSINAIANFYFMTKQSKQ